ncbi:MAG: DsbA family protein [Buchnera aphidicola (Pentalonia nigronervosa)]|jgi:thiol:disulfide interchange protein DsbA|uniref:Thiol:disulfide interchange protein n=1 Tax=Buchnera aphidicola (Pentalonia nigronervosa) TaxID=1309793 RepID=A0A7H1AYS1_9GAMM|nr:MAG: DsbA family protein [Buchnera aphidicola (Pentalonia nigronervosa)]
MILCSIILSFNISAHEFTNKQEYTTKHTKIKHVPKIIELFSFFCPYCYEVQKKYHFSNLINKNLNKNIHIKTYHVNFLGGKLSNVLTKAWIIAQKMKIEDKIMLPMFAGIQKTHTIKNVRHIRELFFKIAGVNINDYNKFWNSLSIKILTKKTNQIVKKCHLYHVPTILINGKYIIDYYRLESIFKNQLPEKYIQLINFLMYKK